MRFLRRLVGLLWVSALAFLLARPSGAQSFDFNAPASAVDAKTPAVMRDLAERMLPVYQESDPDRYLANLSVLQLTAGDYSAAVESRESLHERRRRADSGRPVGRGRVLDIYARAMASIAQSHLAPGEAVGKAYQEIFSRLSDHDAFLLSGWLSASPEGFRENFQRLLDEQRSKDIISRQEAEALLSDYVYFEAYRALAPWVGPLNSAGDAKRYAEEQFNIKVPRRGTVATTVIRPKSLSGPLPALLELGIDRPTVSAKESAAHGYVGVFADMRHKAAGATAFVPYQHDGEVARAVLNWIARQPWSDGRAAMYGEGYSGFTAWAAAARLPPALKAIAVWDPVAPGVDVPMSGNVFQNSAYRWSLEATETGQEPASNAGDEAVWRALDEKWYRSGRRYRDLGSIFGRPNPIFIRWLNHPSYDRFWQTMIPYRGQFAHIDIPVLTMTGYFTAAEPAALYYFSEHHHYDPRADHTLLIGPYEDESMHSGASESIRGYAVDAAALLDLRELRYQWLDHALKGAEIPHELAGRVNVEVMGANEWRHVPSLQAMADASLKFYLSAGVAPEGRRLIRRKNPKSAAVGQTVSLTDRSDAGWLPPSDLITRSLVTHNSVTFVSGALKTPTEFNGQLSGRLDFTVNKMDMDIDIAAYALTAAGDYVRLFNPADELRLSYAGDRSHRHLLKAGERQKLAFVGQRMTSRRLDAGSRLVIVLRVSKRPDREINYGTGNDVSEESIEDGKVPIKVRWYNDSYIEIPVRTKAGSRTEGAPSGTTGPAVAPGPR